MGPRATRAVAITLAAIGLVCAGGVAYQSYAIHALSSALRNAGVREDVSIGGTAYRIEDGYVYQSGIPVTGTRASYPLRLAYAKTLARRNPLIALPGTDPDDLRAAIAGLQNTADTIAKLQEKQSDADIVRSSLYPLSFLTAAAQLEEARIAFLSSGSDVDEKKYESVQREAVSAYQQDLAQYKSAFEHAVPADTGKYVEATSVISREGVLHAIELLASEMARTQKSIRARDHCIGGFFPACNTADIQAPTAPQPKPTEVTPDLLQRAENVREIFAQARRDPQLNSLPLIVLSDSACVGYIPAAPAFVALQTSADDSEVNPRVRYVGDMPLIDTHKLRTVPFYDFLTTHDIAYVWTSPILHYTCSSKALDMGAVLAVQAVSRFAQDAPLHAYAEGDMRERLAALEHSLAASSPILKQSDALEYLGIAARLAKTNALPEASTNAVYDLMLQAQDSSASYDASIRAISASEDANARLDSRNIPVDLSPPYLFFFRSGLELLFMGDNPSVSGMRGDLFAQYAGEHPYTYYSTLPQTADMQAEIVRDLRTYMQMHTLPLSVPTADIFSGY